MTREEWLLAVCEKLRPSYQALHAPVPEKLRVTCGWPSHKALASKNRVIGQCWAKSASKDGTVEVFISPAVSDPVEVAAVLAHELVHATGAFGHRGDFKKIATAIGLTGPMRSTVAGDALKARLNTLTQEIGLYPHASLDGSMGPVKKQSTRLLAVTCPRCGYKARIARKWVDIGLPTCPCEEIMELEGGDHV